MLTATALAAALAVHAPVVVHDAQERHPLASVAAAHGPEVYGRVAASAGGAWLQYWLYYRVNDQDRGIVRTGRHAGDWEMVQVRVDPAGRPSEVVYAQHSGGEREPWRAVRRRGTHPVVYVAHGSHASYLRPGVRDRTWPDPNDEADGRGTVVRPRLVRVTAATPPFMRRRAPWGGARARWWIPGEQSSPRGPAFQPQGRWSDPDGWAAAARTGLVGCDRVNECDGRERLVAGGGAVAVALLLALLVGGEKRRRRT